MIKIKQIDIRKILVFAIVTYFLSIGCCSLVAQTSTEQDRLLKIKDSLQFNCIFWDEMCDESEQAEREWLRWVHGDWVWHRRAMIGEKEILIPRRESEHALPTDTLIKIPLPRWE